VEESLTALVEFTGGKTLSLDFNWDYVDREDRWWFDVLATRGSAQLSPLHVVKELNGRATDVTPRGAAARESAFMQSYRAELAHFVAMVADDTDYEPPTDQLAVHRLSELIYRSAEEGKEIRPS
jgi:predicted dehydrogenase